jgi:hypothetical protein
VHQSHVLTEIAGWTAAFCTWLLACVGIVCLPFSLHLEAGPHRQPQVANQSAEQSRESVPFSSHQILPTPNRKLIRPRASPGHFFCPPDLFFCLGFLGADDVSPKGPPWLNYRGPPDTCSGASVSCKVAGQTSSPRARVLGAFSRNFDHFRHQRCQFFETHGFVTGSN